ncbi:MAG: BMC domain-containing protein [Propionibacteriaceae bacterium]|jgi:microcompartment protein CcmL/EutN|nr:BMC domain-containing protein [Propionibacteriaceae bacterium]
MITSIGLVELTSIARGVETTDAMLKAGGVTLVFAKPVCPGKFIVLVHGDIGAVTEALNAGLAVGADRVVNHLTIPRVHPDLLPAMNGTTQAEPVGALGVVEFFDIASAVTAADAAAKAARVTVLEVRLGMGIGGKSFFKLGGEVADVKAAVDAAIAATGERGPLVSSCVIPAPDPALYKEMM